MYETLCHGTRSSNKHNKLQKFTKYHNTQLYMAPFNSIDHDLHILQSKFDRVRHTHKLHFIISDSLGNQFGMR